MIPVETVIRKLIVDYEFVVLPGFGALLSHQVPVSFDNDSGIFSPPVKRLAFNEFLKLDDGLLANYISRHEQISHIEAVDYVKRYTDRLRAMLLSRGVAKIEGIGQFSSNVEGKLVFDPNTEKHFKDEWYGFRNVNAMLVQTEPSLTSGFAKNATEEEIEVVEVGVDGQLGVRWWRWTAAAMLIGLIGYFSLFFVSGNAENKSTLNPFTTLFESEGDNKTTKSDQFISNTEGGQSVLKTESENTAEVLDSTEVELTAGPVSQVNSTPITTDAESALADEGKFFVIAGAFKGSKQANVLLNELKKMGFEDALLLPADKFNSKVKVAINSYQFETDAYAASKKLKDVIGEIGWVYERK